MRKARQQSKPNLRTDNFDSSVVQAAWTYDQQIGAGYAKGNVRAEVAAFIAGACWAKEVLAEKGEG
jgi:hypothetical protein